ncbi:MAG: 7-cyano-7-deazaguanine/7-aminomethyl-7-deazaguanine transporter [Chitinophagales bacterium]|nr:7-cyano-7-deazaguanine/7-aminomethyl-7-deazaguanine transporter [Chitinophagales bacterium]
MKNIILKWKLSTILVIIHIGIIALSNYLVQFPISILGYSSTYGAFTFPLIFLTTDLTVRFFGAQKGRKIILLAMLPALIVSYVVTTLFRNGVYLGFNQLSVFDLFVFRIAIASFSAYVFGQVLDVFVFNRLRKGLHWWYAPTASGVLGSFTDTFIFFFIAFYKTSDFFLANHWVEIATVDYFFKILVQCLFFLPTYKFLLDYVTKRILRE